MILKFEITIVIAIIFTYIYYRGVRLLLDRIDSLWENTPSTFWVFLSSIVFYFTIIIYTLSIYIPITSNPISEVSVTEAQSSEILPDILTRVPKHERILTVYENKNNIKSIPTTARSLPKFKETIVNIFDEYDDQIHDTIILTTVGQTSLGKHLTTIQYVHLDNLSNEYLNNIGIDDELLDMMNSIQLNDLVLIIGNSDTIERDYTTFFYTGEYPDKQSNKPYWSIPEHK